MTIYRNSTTLYIETPGATTTFPWTGNKPDFSNFSEATRNVFEDEWLLNQNNVSVIDDPVIAPEVLIIDWVTFSNALLVSPAYGRYVNINPITSGIVNTLIVGMYAKEGSDLYNTFIETWGYLEASIPVESKLTEQERTEINNVAEFCNIPFRLNNSNLIYLI